MKLKSLKKNHKVLFKSAIIVSHEASSGPEHDLRDYLRVHAISSLLCIYHPLVYLEGMEKKRSYYELYRKGVLIQSKSAYHWVLPEYLLYIKDFFYTWYWILSLRFKSDIYFGVNNLNALTGIVLRFFGYTKLTVYYVIDYVPKRFKSKMINSIYHQIEKFAAEKSNWTWNLSPRMIEGRNKKWQTKMGNQLVVPHGVHYKRIVRVEFSKVNKYEIIYMGTILKKQGIQFLLDALPIIRKRIPSVSLTIIGRGPYEEVLKETVKKKKLEKQVTFLGYMPSHQSMENRLAQAAIAIALYNRKEDTNDFTYYADPGKIKNYLGAGLPIIMTDVAWIAKEVDQKKCGMIVALNTKDISQKIIQILSNTKILQEYRKNALVFAKKYEWDTIFQQTFMQMQKDL